MITRVEELDLPSFKMVFGLGALGTGGILHKYVDPVL